MPSPACKNGQIRRTAYSRRSYTRKNGRVVRGTRVSAACITDRGASGKWTAKHGTGIGPLKAGRLSKYGYSSSKAASARQMALSKAITAYGPLSVYRMLNAVYVYTKRTSPAVSALYKADRDWVGAKHGYKSA
jgi:hypothetical protein